MASLLRSRVAWAVACLLAVVGLYALLGFKVAPKIARDQAQAFVRDNYGRELAIGAIAIHPFKLQVEVRDLALPDNDGQLMLGFERLFVDFEVASLWNRAFTFREVSITAPTASAVVRPDGSLNLADLALPEDPHEPDEPLPAIWIQSLAVERGALHFADTARPKPFDQDFADVGFKLLDFRTTPEGGDFSFQARGTEGGEFAWEGRFALEPAISSQGSFRVTGLNPPGVGEFLGETLPAMLTKGSISLAGTYATTLDETIALEVTLPQIEMTGLGVRARGADSDWVDIPSLVVSDTQLSLAQQTVGIGKVAVTGLAAQAWMNPDGSVNLEQLFAVEPASATPAPPAEAAGGATEEQPWAVTIGTVELSGASITFEDRTLTPASRFEISPVNVRVSDASLDLSRPLPVTVDAVVNGVARFDASGTVTAEPLAAELDVRLAKASLQVLQPYVLPLADLTIAAGELDVLVTAQAGIRNVWTE